MGGGDKLSLLSSELMNKMRSIYANELTVLMPNATKLYFGMIHFILV